MTTTAVHPAPMSGVGRPRSSRGHRVIRVAQALLILAVLGLLVAVFPVATVADAAGDFASASWGWLLIGLTAGMASMAAFAVLRRRTLSAAGAPVTIRSATSISYSAGAVHMTMPAGAVFATGYTFRRFRGVGARPAAVTWSLTASGILSGLSLAGLGIAGLLLHGAGGGWQTALRAAGTGLVTLLVARWVVHSPEKPAAAAEAMLRRFNRLRHRPADTGVARLRGTVADLRQVRPTGRDWAVSASAAVANWLFDLGCLVACAAAFHLPIDLWVLLTAYAVAMGASSLSPLPAGIGVVDSALVVGLTASGAPAALAIAAVLLYRLLANGSVLVIGWALLAGRSLRRPFGRHFSHLTAPLRDAQGAS